MKVSHHGLEKPNVSAYFLPVITFLRNIYEVFWEFFIFALCKQSSVFPFQIDGILGKLVNHIPFSQYILKPFLVLCFASCFPVVYTSNLFSIILNIWFHNYFSFTTCTVVSPGLPRVSSCPLHCAVCALTVCVKYSYFGAYHNIFCEMSHIAPTQRVSHSHMSSESYIIEQAT